MQKIYTNKDRTIFGVYDEKSDRFELLQIIDQKVGDVSGGGTIQDKPIIIKKFVQKVPKIRKRGQRICSICGEPGHHAKTCKKRKDAIPGVVEEYRHKATEEDISRIQEIKESGGKSHEAALELKLHLAEVNKHWID
jgi:hypothetical protein